MTDDIIQPAPVLAFATCGYLVPSPEQRGQPPHGTCRANPPTVLLVPGRPSIENPNMPTAQMVAAWPTVAVSEWCGAHTALVDDDPPEASDTPPAIEQH